MKAAEVPPPGACWCGKPSRGWCAAEADVPVHNCLECSADHCRLEVLAHGCEFGLCTRRAEIELTLSTTVDPVRVCGLHVAAVLGWGVPDPVVPTVKYLAA